jgi:hypothetical protein
MCSEVPKRNTRGVAGALQSAKIQEWDVGATAARGCNSSFLPPAQYAKIVHQSADLDSGSIELLETCMLEQLLQMSDSDFGFRRSFG